MPIDLDRRILARILDVKRQAEDRNRKISAAILTAYEAVEGDPRFCVRRREVVEHVARALGIRVVNNRLFGDVEAAAQGLGFQAVRNGGRSLFRCVKRRDLDADKALAVALTNRHDPRIGRPSPPPDGHHTGGLGL